MPSSYLSVLIDVGVVILLGAAMILVLKPDIIGKSFENTPEVVVLHSTAPNPKPEVMPLASTTTLKIPPEVAEKSMKEKGVTEADTSALPQKTEVSSSTPSSRASRVKNPYTLPKSSIEELNTKSRGALVNILCEAQGGNLYPISGSGLIIDQRGVILTNAHVAQYLLLENRSDYSASCVVRTGSPAREYAKAKLLYIPSRWVEKHAKDLRNAHPVGTGEDDYALLIMTESATSNPLPPAFSHVPFDTREAIGFTGDTVLAAAYPAEFIGNSARTELHVVTAVAQIKQLLTFTETLVDAVSLGGTAIAQSGSSGGAVVNEWGHLIALIVTTSEGISTDQRDLRAITLAHVDRSMIAQTGTDLAGLLSRNLSASATEFSQQSQNLTEILVSALTTQP